MSIPKLKGVIRLDGTQVYATHFTDEGYLFDKPILTRTGIFEYDNGDGTIRKELRLPEDVFDPESLASYKGKPIIVTHQAGLIDKDNVEDEQIGTILSQGEKFDGDKVVAEIVIHDTDAMKECGLRELSIGYTLDLEEEPGVWHGIEYDAIQRNIRVNHLALVKEARAGDDARLNIDSKSDLTFRTGGHQTHMAKMTKTTISIVHEDGIVTDAELDKLVKNYLLKKEKSSKGQKEETDAVDTAVNKPDDAVQTADDATKEQTKSHGAPKASEAQAEVTDAPAVESEVSSDAAQTPASPKPEKPVSAPVDTEKPAPQKQTAKPPVDANKAVPPKADKPVPSKADKPTETPKAAPQGNGDAPATKDDIKALKAEVEALRAEKADYESIIDTLLAKTDYMTAQQQDEDDTQNGLEDVTETDEDDVDENTEDTEEYDGDDGTEDDEEFDGEDEYDEPDENEDGEDDEDDDDGVYGEGYDGDDESDDELPDEDMNEDDDDDDTVDDMNEDDDDTDELTDEDVNEDEDDDDDEDNGQMTLDDMKTDGCGSKKFQSDHRHDGKSKRADGRFSYEDIDKIAVERAKVAKVGWEIHLDGLEAMPLRQAKEQIIHRVHPGFKLDGKSNDYVEAAYKLAVKEIRESKKKSTAYQAGQMFNADSRDYTVKKSEEGGADAARAKMMASYMKDN